MAAVTGPASLYTVLVSTEAATLRRLFVQLCDPLLSVILLQLLLLCVTQVTKQRTSSTATYSFQAFKTEQWQAAVTTADIYSSSASLHHSGFCSIVASSTHSCDMRQTGLSIHGTEETACHCASQPASLHRPCTFHACLMYTGLAFNVCNGVQSCKPRHGCCHGYSLAHKLARLQTQCCSSSASISLSLAPQLPCTTGCPGLSGAFPAYPRLEACASRPTSLPHVSLGLDDANLVRNIKGIVVVHEPHVGLLLAVWPAADRWASGLQHCGASGQ